MHAPKGVYISDSVLIAKTVLDLLPSLINEGVTLQGSRLSLYHWGPILFFYETLETLTLNKKETTSDLLLLYKYWIIIHV